MMKEELFEDNYIDNYKAGHDSITTHTMKLIEWYEVCLINTYKKIERVLEIHTPDQIDTATTKKIKLELMDNHKKQLKRLKKFAIEDYENYLRSIDIRINKSINFKL